MWRLPFFDALADAQRILITGAGGGFDVYAGLPLLSRTPPASPRSPPLPCRPAWWRPSASASTPTTASTTYRCWRTSPPLDRDGHYLGAFTVPSHGREAALYRDAVEHARAATPGRASIVNGQIAAALTGAAGDVPVDGRTGETPLFVNPLMAMYFTFDLPGLAARSLYLDRIRSTDDMLQVSHIIETFRDEIDPRPRIPFPH